MKQRPEYITDEMIASFLSGEISSNDAQIMNSWLNLGTEAQEIFSQYKTVWEETGKIIPKPVFVDTDKAWQTMQNKMKEPQMRIVYTTNKYKFLWKIAAVFVPVVLLSIFFYFLTKPKIATQIATNEVVRRILNDGSEITLNKNSQINFPEKFSKKKREIQLFGEAFFKIKADKSKPFIIKTNTITIEVVGTAFNVKSYAKDSLASVSVESGIVKVYLTNKKNTDTIKLQAGEQGIYNLKNKNLIKENKIGANDFFWINKSLVFKRNMLKEVFEILENNYTVKIDIQNRDLLSQHFSATFNDQSIEDILEVICKTFNLKKNKNGTHYLLENNE